MNKFEKSFFSKYLPEWYEIKWVLHIHFIEIFLKIFLWIIMWAIIPSFLYYYSVRIQWLIPFLFLEILLIWVYINIIYSIFDWYNDVWIVTNFWIIQLERSLFKNNSKTVEYEKIEWMEVIQEWIIDKILQKWDLVIHKIWDDTFVLKNCINPYNCINFIEDVSQESQSEWENKNQHYDLIMDALWWIVEKYIQKRDNNQENQELMQKLIKEAKNKKWTIDLRDE